MVATAIIPPDTVIAGGIVINGQTYTINHNQLTGNTQGKLNKIRAALQENVYDIRVLSTDFPVDDIVHPDHIDNPGYNTYDDPILNDQGEVLKEHIFYWQENPNRLWVIHRSVAVDIILELTNDPTLGGEDRYVLKLMALYPTYLPPGVTADGLVT